jgi:hypothetical protein
VSVSDEGYSRNVSWALDLIATFESLIGIGKINNNLIKQFQAFLELLSAEVFAVP